ncbi:hypothetical protein [Tabrizicola sp.]|uniref:hypothetical protein n=1 Tax=Tabrizicola sp. TaxID=2005166 RepID=UPI003D2CE362
MSSEVLVALIGSLTTALVAGGGWWFAWKLHLDGKARERQQARMRRVLAELHARVVFERKANEWIAELDERTSRSAMLEIRKRVKDELGYGPDMSEQEIKKMLASAPD